MRGKYILAGFMIVVLFGTAIFGVSKLPNAAKSTIINNQFVQHFLHTYHSLRKLPDIVFFPSWFLKPKLPVYELVIDPIDIALLNSVLSDEPIRGELLEENRLFVNATFISGDYIEKVDVRYRGKGANHWNSLKKSLRVSFPQEHLFNGMKAMNLVIAYDRNYFVEPLNGYRARKLGLHTPEMSFVRLKINAQDAGVYISFENWSDKWLEKVGLPKEGKIFGIDEKAGDAGKSVFSETGRGRWKEYNFESDTNDEISALVALVTQADDQMFAKLAPILIDLNKFYAWNVINILAGSHSQDDFNNLTLFFNTATGKFEFIPWDVEISELNGSEYKERSVLAQRILSVPEFRDARNKLLDEYVSNEDNLRDDLAFYDALYKKTRGDFFNDNEKLYNNFSFLFSVRSFRKLFEENFKRAGLVLEQEYELGNRVSKLEVRPPTFPGSFKYLSHAVATIYEFVRENPQFVKTASNAAALLSGTHVFTSTVVVPRAITLKIHPGAQLLLGGDVSFVSYSPIDMQGLVGASIIVTALDYELPWGSFMVISTGNKKSVFNKVHFSYGSGASINGVVSTGMLSLHESDASIKNSSFRNSTDDDAVNTKYGTVTIENSTFSNTYSDAIDIDYTSGVIKNNEFYPPIGMGEEEKGGDAIDISFSDIVIANNTIYGCGDKGISIGEKSSPEVIDNVISNCDIGIAVKDLSHAVITGGELKSNRIGISVYQKKQVFGGATVDISGVILENNQRDFEKDEVSLINKNHF